MAKQIVGFANKPLIMVGVATVVFVALIAAIRKKVTPIPIKSYKTTFADEHFCGDAGVCTL